VRRRPSLTRSLTTFLEGPASVRLAIRVIVAATVVTTFLGGLLVWIFDRDDYPHFGDAMWWSLQTVTTVGYGDVTPTNTVGRIIGAAILLYAVAFLSILTAAITTSFVERARRERRPEEEPDLHAVLAAIDALSARLARLDERLGAGENGDDPERSAPR
jgi:voltage-gated potassium channel